MHAHFKEKTLTDNEHDDVQEPFGQVPLVREGFAPVEVPVAAGPKNVAEPRIEQRGDCMDSISGRQ